MKVPRLTIQLSILTACAWLPAQAAALNFEKNVFPILKESCVSCHRQAYKEGGKLKKPKAALRLDGARGFLEGSENGEVLVPGKPEKSTLYTLTVLPHDDPDVMPSKGDPLTKAQAATLRQWIKDGADFGGWKGNQQGYASKLANIPAILEPLPVDILAASMTPLPVGTLKSAAASGAYIRPLAKGHPLLFVSFLGNAPDITDKDLTRLSTIRNNITDLDLSRTQITDNALRTVSDMGRLTTLNLHSTAVTDKGVASLKSLRHLLSLNLYNTKITNKSVATLGKMKQLRSLYLWQTDIDTQDIQTLRKALPKTEIYLHSTLTSTPVNDTAGTNRPKRTFDPGSCCARANRADKPCPHGCCKAAAAKKTICSKCNPIAAKG